MYYTLVTLGVFGFILTLTRLKVPLWLCVLIGSLTSGLFFRLGIGQSLLAVLAGAVQLKTIGLVVITMLIMSLSQIMNRTGLMQEIVTLAQQVLRRPAVVMAALPALIGLLPMPGGALFSAPMVKSAAGDVKVTPAAMSAINYWYRHIWEHWWPLYPGVMLTMTMTGLSFLEILRYQMAMGLFMAAAGLLLFRKTHPDLHLKGAKPSSGTKRKLLIAICPVWVLVLAWIPANFLLSNFTLANSNDQAVLVLQRFAPLAFALLVAIAVTCIVRRVKVIELLAVFKRKTSWIMQATVVSVMIFQYIFTMTGASEKIADELLRIHVPVVLVVAILPLVAGLVTGIAVGFVGTSFPIVLALITGLDSQIPLHAYIVLAYGFGHLGQMISPIHICHIVSNQYFGTGFTGVYRRMMPTFLLTFMLIAGYFTILANLGT